MKTAFVVLLMVGLVFFTLAMEAIHGRWKTERVWFCGFVGCWGAAVLIVSIDMIKIANKMP